MNPFWVNVLNFYSLRTPENRTYVFFFRFQGVESWNIGSKRVKHMDKDPAHFDLLIQYDPLTPWFVISN